VNNYLLGKKPPAFDIMFWNADTTRMSATLHADFVDLALENKLTTPAAITVRGVPVDLSKVEVDSYVIAGFADHLTPWQSCYRSTGLLGGRAGSSSPPAATSRRWSTRRATRRPATRSTRRPRPTRRRG
jgi:polyhydroxyalkanoate synthase